MIAQERIIRCACMQIGMRHHCGIVQNGVATTAAALFHGLFECFHDEQIGIRLLVQEAQGEFRCESTSHHLLDLRPASAVVFLRLCLLELLGHGCDEGLIAAVDQIKAQLQRQQTVVRVLRLHQIDKHRCHQIGLSQDLIHQHKVDGGSALGGELFLEAIGDDVERFLAKRLAGHQGYRRLERVRQHGRIRLGCHQDILQFGRFVRLKRNADGVLEVSLFDALIQQAVNHPLQLIGRDAGAIFVVSRLGLVPVDLLAALLDVGIQGGRYQALHVRSLDLKVEMLLTSVEGQSERLRGLLQVEEDAAGNRGGRLSDLLGHLGVFRQRLQVGQALGDFVPQRVDASQQLFQNLGLDLHAGLLQHGDQPGRGGNGRSSCVRLAHGGQHGFVLCCRWALSVSKKQRMSNDELRLKQHALPCVASPFVCCVDEFD
mmetsp:Transcript_12245/g.35520  ORF Transcript_12245/g.35520 Transcript_12245/m.35520 type:complete len:430 (+) Transcript_12245:2186-3475(+)